MKLWETLPPGTLEAVRQAYRQGADWRKVLRHSSPPANPDKDTWPEHYAKLDEIAAELEAHYFPGLPRIVRFAGRGDPPQASKSAVRRDQPRSRVKKAKKR